MLSVFVSTPVTSVMDSRHGSSLEWCSYGPTNTTGRSFGGIRSRNEYFSLSPAGSRISRIPMSLLIAAVAPEPQKITRSSSVPPTESRMSRRACSRNLVVYKPVPELSVWVLA
jgi:hypothetical protein